MTSGYRWATVICLVVTGGLRLVLAGGDCSSRADRRDGGTAAEPSAAALTAVVQTAAVQRPTFRSGVVQVPQRARPPVGRSEPVCARQPQGLRRRHDFAASGGSAQARSRSTRSTTDG